MKIKIQKETILEKLNKLSPAIGEYIKVSSNASEITFESFNREMMCKIKVMENVSEELSPKALDPLIGRLIQKMPNGLINLDFKESLVEISSNKTKIQANYLNTHCQEFKFDYNDSNILEIKNLKKCIKKVQASLAKENNNLSGINFSSSKDKLYIQTTDRMRISQIIEEFDGMGIDITIPGTSLLKILSVLEKDNVQLYYTKYYMMILGNDASYVLRTFDSKYPNLNNCIPATFDFSYEVNREELLEILERAMLMPGDYVKVTIGINQFQLFKQSETGTLTEEIEVKAINGINLITALSNVKFRDALKHLEKETIFINGCSNMKPIVIMEDEKTKQIVLPLRVI